MSFNYFLILITLLFSCSHLNLIKKGEWHQYKPSGFDDNQQIIKSQEFIDFQKLPQHNKFPQKEAIGLIDTISPYLVDFLSSFDKIWDGKDSLRFKFRFDSVGHIGFLRFFNNVPLNDTQSFKALHKHLSDISFTSVTDYHYAFEVGLLALKKNGNISIKKIGGNYFVEKSRPRQQIINIVMENVKRLQVVYDKKLRDNKSLKGQITLRFIIREDGTIPQISIIESNIEDADFSATVLDVVKSWKFTPLMSTFDICDVTYPFNFSK
jgi:TonB family protein